MPLGNMVLDGPEAFCADHMFNAAGILRGCLFIHAKVHEPLGEHGVAFVHGFGDFLSHAAEGDVPLVIHEDITVFTQILHCHADTGLGKGQFVGDVDGADIGFLRLKIKIVSR